MADENKTDDNNLSTLGVQLGMGDTSAPANQEPQVNSPVGEEPASGTPEPKHVPYSRLKEVIDQKNANDARANDWEGRFKQLESRMQAEPNPAPAGSNVNPHLKGLIDGGMDENVAKLIVETAQGISRENVDNRVGSLEQQNVQREMASWTEKFSRDHTDYKQLEPEMGKVFSALPERTQDLIVSDPAGLELLYGHVKSQFLEKAIAEGNQAGKNQAYDNIALKQAVASTPGASSQSTNNAITRASLAAMSPTEFSERQVEIFDLMAQGKIK